MASFQRLPCANGPEVLSWFQTSSNKGTKNIIIIYKNLKKCSQHTENIILCPNLQLHFQEVIFFLSLLVREL